MSRGPLADDETDDGSLTISCNTCGRPHSADQEIQPSVTTPEGTDWQLSVSVSDEGETTIHEAYCPKHRLTQSIDALVAKSERMTRSSNRLSSAVRELDAVQ